MKIANVLDLPEPMRSRAQRALDAEGARPMTATPIASFGAPAPRAIDAVSRGVDVKPAKRRNKFGNERVTIDGETYDSKAEYLFHQDLKRRRTLGEIGPLILRQVPFRLEGGVTYRADFVVNPTVFPFVEIWDVKGKDTQASINKRKQVLARYGIEVRIWRRGDAAGEGSC